MNNMHDDVTLTRILSNARSIAIIGAKDNASQPVNIVGTYLLTQGYTVFPVHPVRKQVWNLKAYPNIQNLPAPVDIVVVFRAPEYCATHAQEFLKMHPLPKVFWMQLGISSPEAVNILLKQDIMVVENRCIKIEHERLIPSLKSIFDCKQCGHCCLGEGGIVLTPKDIHRLTTGLGMTKEAFLERYTKIRQGKPSIITNDAKTCIFFDEQKQCLVHNDKPDVCRAWPFFAGNMCDNISFAMAKDFCPGINPLSSHTDFVHVGNMNLHGNGIDLSTDASQPNALKPIKT